MGKSSMGRSSLSNEPDGHSEDIIRIEVRILIVEDDPRDAELVEYTLKSAGIDFTSLIVETEKDYRNAIYEFAPDIILSDYNLPCFNGEDALRIAKELRSDLPFILFTGAIGEERAVEVLTGGATDYVMKNRLSRLAPAVERALHEADEHKRRKGAERERDRLLNQLESRVLERTAALQKEIEQRKRVEEALNAANNELEDKVRKRTELYKNTNEMLLNEIAERKRAEQELRENQELLLEEIEERKRTEKMLRSAQKNLREMAAEIVVADEKANRNLATILHDTVVQSLGAAKLRTQLIQDRIPEDAKPIYSELQELLSESITRARSIMTEMSPPVLNELGIVSALEWLTEQIVSKRGINIKFRSNRNTVKLDHEIQILLFQATRELLMNIIKHAGASRVEVRFSDHSERVWIEVNDNGRGFDVKETFHPNLEHGFGLYSIRERLQHIGGNLAIRSKPTHGTQVVIMAPKKLSKSPSE